MQTAWRERNPGARIKAAKEAIGLNPECATAYILLAEEEVPRDILKLAPVVATVAIGFEDQMENLNAAKRQMFMLKNKSTQCFNSDSLSQQALDIAEAETKFREAFRIAETNYRRSQQLQHQNALMESQHRRDTNVMIYIRRRLAMCTWL